MAGKCGRRRTNRTAPCSASPCRWSSSQGSRHGSFHALKRWWIAGGLAYGVGIFFVMNYVVVPLSAVHRVPHFTVQTFVENMLAMLLFGVIVAWFGRGAVTETEPQKATA